MPKEYIYGRIPVQECLSAKRRTPHCLFLQEGIKETQDLYALAMDASIPIEKTSRKALNRMSHDGVHQGVVLETESLPVYDLDQWLSDTPATQVMVVILDGIEDPHNFGAIARTAAACGAAALLFSKDRSAPLSSTAMKSAAGAMEYIDLIQVTNLPRALDILKEANFWIAGMDAEGDKLLWDADLTGRTGLVIGSEGKGMRPLVQKKCDYIISIPISGPITSLNASVSASVALVEYLRQAQK